MAGRWSVPILVAGAILGAFGYRVLVHDSAQAPAEAAAHIAVAWTFLVAGLIGWARRPQSRVGLLLTLAGFGLLIRRLQYSHNSALFTTAFALSELSNVLIAHAVLAYPEGRLERVERFFVSAGYFLALAFPVATLAVYDPAHSPCLFFCGFGDPPHSLLLIHPDAGAFEGLRDAYRISVFGVLGAVLIALIVRKFVVATPARRRTLVPLVVAGAAAGVRAVSEGVLTFSDYSERTRQILFWWQIAAQIALPVALLVGLLRARLAKASVGQLLLELERTPAAGVRDALARSLGDPSLEVVFWVPARMSYVDGAGKPVVLPDHDSGRAVTPLDHGDEPVAALVHDPALLDDPVLFKAAGAAARFALENARLQAELRAQLAAVRESRSRLVAAGDTERRKLEQDLHDGAQQRLVALALELRSAQRRLGDRLDSSVETVLASAVTELKLAVEELRELAHGVHPPVLTQGGLSAAFDELARRAPIPISVLGVPQERLAPEVESAAYFVVCEALANVVKHSNARSATIRASRRDGDLVVEIWDDGVGGADAARGTGLRGLYDRVEAHGGRLKIVSDPGQGTRILGEIPCGS